jgi:DNA-binding XRE family transcriptional regulator
MNYEKLCQNFIQSAVACLGDDCVVAALGVSRQTIWYWKKGRRLANGTHVIQLCHMLQAQGYHASKIIEDTLYLGLHYEVPADNTDDDTSDFC